MKDVLASVGKRNITKNKMTPCHISLYLRMIKACLSVTSVLCLAVCRPVQGGQGGSSTGQGEISGEV